ncbi:hypothetical protein [Aureibacter tunicatorum]|uniref:ABC-type anion transport system duplicated permease subunit n=1 Tax=Aureibacter tunicatorum TaxID=866807 RepID=A0AAE3XJG3_9BACT|nr:hypothetical protein [Aureibacter tunicatorum]MDR6237075.1 ABC-type anion transport system duplicated permease subunit [Aureibacter tunicatorum]BDD06067.1 hypothetical protein AUTU_35500 [Aureibacter tunicatorum]
MSENEKKQKHKAYPPYLPAPTWYPLVVAFGITFIFWGIVTLYVLSLIGLALLAYGVYGWIWDMRIEIKEISEKEAENE